MVSVIPESNAGVSRDLKKLNNDISFSVQKLIIISYGDETKL